MSEGVIAALLAGLLAFFGTCVTAWATTRKFHADLRTAQAVTDCKLDELTREVRLHNSFAEKIPVMELRLNTVEQHLQTSDGTRPIC